MNLPNKSKLKSQNNLTWWISIIIILLFAFYLRIVGLGDHPLWFDESIEYWMAVVRPPLIAQAVSQATHDPPLYSYLLHFWMSGGISEFWLRLPSLIASLLSIIGIIYLGQILCGRTVGLIAGLILAVSAADVHYAQEVGQYSLMVCFTTWNLVFLYQAVRHDRWLWWSLWGLTAMLNIYTHYGAAIVILATSSTILLYHFWQRDWQKVGRQIIIGIVVILLLSPLVLFVIPQQLGRLGATTEQISLSNLWQSSWLIIVFQFTGNPGITNWPWPHITRWWVTVPAALAICISLIRAHKFTDLPILLIFTWLVYYLISRTGIYFFSPSRHSLLLIPLTVLSIAIGTAAVYRWHRLAGIGLLLFMLPLPLLIPAETSEDLRALTQYWQGNRQADELTYVYYGAAPGFRYQLDVQQGTASDLPINWYNQCYKGEPKLYCREDKIYYGQWTRELPPNEQRAAFQAVAGPPPDRFWIIMSHIHEPDRELLLEGFAQDYRIIDDHQESNVAAILLEKR